MDNVSQLVLRQADRLPAGAVALVNPPPDALFQELASRGNRVSLSSGSRGDFRRLEAMGAEVSYQGIPGLSGDTDSAILVLPREKEKLAMLLHALGRQLEPGGRLWLVGPNRAGIKSSPRVLQRYFESVQKLDSARHCTLFEATQPLDTAPFRLSDYQVTWPFDFAGRRLEIVSLPGVFAHGRLDRGTALLLEALEALRPSGRVLDFASGCGIVGLCIKAAAADSDITLLDDSALAIEAGERTMRQNGFQARSLPSDGLSEAAGRFDWIVSNPPFHRGVGNDLDIAARFFRSAGTFLAENGRILVVFNRHLPYTGWLHESFKRVDCLAKNREFTVVQASEIK